MIYVKRDEQGKISAISNEKSQGFTDAEISESELVEFIAQSNSSENLKLLQADLEFIRVLEDVIDVLIQKNIINITDFPAPVVEKLLQRQGIRSQVSGSLGMEFYEDEDD